MGAESDRSGARGTGLLLVLATALVSGVSTFVNAYAVGATSSDAFVTVRNLAVAALLVPVFLLGARAARPGLRRSDWARLVAIGVVGGGIPFLLFFRGLQLATDAGGAATASLLYRLLFVIATILAVVVLKERFHWRVALAGALLVAGNVLLLSFTTPIWNDGAAYVLAATGLWAVEYTVSKRLLASVPSGTVALGRMGFGAAFLVGYLAATSQLGAVGAFTGTQWMWVAISAVLLGAFVVTWYAGLARVDLSVATAVLVLGFPVTWLLGVTLRGSPVLVGQFAGAAVVAAGVVVVAGRVGWREVWRSMRRPSAAA